MHVMMRPAAKCLSILCSRVTKSKLILKRIFVNEVNASGGLCSDWPVLKYRCPLFDAGAAMQIGPDLQPGSAAEARAIDLQILHDPLHVIAGLGERDQFDPVDRIDLGIARIAVALDPFLDAAAAGVVGRERHDVGAAIILDQPAELRSAKGGVVDRIDLQPAEVKAGAVFLAYVFA